MGQEEGEFKVMHFLGIAGVMLFLLLSLSVYETFRREEQVGPPPLGRGSRSKKHN